MSNDDKLIENAKAEREFLHDISTPLMIAMGHIEVLSKKGIDHDLERAAQRVEKTFNALKSLSDKLKDRRAVLHEISGKT